MSADVGAYHVLELQIASNPADLRRVMPRIQEHHRRILDVGCGAGQTLLASTLEAQVSAVGIDCDEEALRLGHRLGSRVNLVRARGESLPLASGGFDLVISRVALPYMQTRTAMAEMARVLAPGGNIWFALHPFARVADSFMAHLRRFEVMHALERLYVMANGALLHLTGREFRSPFTGRFESFQTEARVVHELERLGFKDIKVQMKAFFIVSATKK